MNASIHTDNFLINLWCQFLSSILGVFLFTISTSAFPFYDPFDLNNNGGEYNPYFQVDDYGNDFDDQNEINYQQVGGVTGGSSSDEYRGGGGGGNGGGGGGGGGGATNPPQTPAPPTNRPTTVPPRPTTPCRGDTCGGGVPPVNPIPRAGPGQPLPRAGPVGPIPRADPGGPVLPRTDKPKIFTIANNIAKSQGGPLKMSFPNLVAVVSVGGVLLVSAAGVTAYVMVRRRW